MEEDLKDWGNCFRGFVVDEFTGFELVGAG
jgi:hypothetical protein